MHAWLRGIGRVFTTGEVINIKDAYADDRFNQEVDRRTGYRTKTILCMPVLNKAGVVIGVIQVLNKASGAFDDDDARLLQALTLQASIALENARLFEDVVHIKNYCTNVIQSMSQALVTLDEDGVIITTNKAFLQLLAPEGTVTLERVRRVIGAVKRAASRRTSSPSKSNGNDKPPVPRISFAGSDAAELADDGDDGGDDDDDADDGTRLRTFHPELRLSEPNLRNAVSEETAGNQHAAVLAELKKSLVGLRFADVFGTDMRLDWVRATSSSEDFGGSRIDRRDSQGTLGLPVSHSAELNNGDAVNSVVTGAVRERNTALLSCVERSRCTGLSDTVPDMDVVLPFDGLVHAVNVTTAALTTNAHVADSPAESGSAVDGLLIMLEDLSHEKRMRNTMARYMSPEIVDKLMNDGEGALGGSSLDVTCMFTDIRSFTSVSEKIGPEETVKLLNSYFSIMVDIVMESGGILDKFIGDALFAVFGAPYPSVDDADRAVQAGVAMLRACHVFNQERVAEGKDPVLMGVGVNTGPVISGNIGSQKRMDYTVIGDAVNLASRLEGANKQYGTEFLISQSTLDLLKGSYLVRDVDVIVVKGKSEGVKIYQVRHALLPL